MDTQTKSTGYATLNIGGMTCSGCANTVQNALNEMDGVMEATVDLENESARVRYDSSAADESDFKQAVDLAGYEFKGMCK